jgi:hypothetical protein
MAQIDSLDTTAIIALVNSGTWPQKFALVQGNLSALNAQLAADCSVASNMVVHVKNTGSAADTAGVFAFEGSVDSTTGSDGTWFPLQATRSGDGTQETGRAASSLAAGAANPYAWKIATAGIMWFRVRCSTASTASSVMAWTIARSAKGSDPSVINQSASTVTISGTPSVNSTPVGTTPVSVASTLITQEIAGTKYQAQSTASTNAAVIKASAGALLELSAFNGSASTVYVKLYDKATTPAPATDSALLMDIIPITAGARSIQIEYGTAGKKFTSGIGIAIVANPANTDATAVAVGVTVSGTYY